MQNTRSIELEMSNSSKNKKPSLILTEKKIGFQRSKSKVSGFRDHRIIEINDDDISRKHCSVLSFDDKYYLKDEGSLNGTYFVVPSQKIIVLKNEMALKIGKIIYKIALIGFDKIVMSYTIIDEEAKIDKDIEFVVNNKRSVGLGFSKDEIQTYKFIGINDAGLSQTQESHIVFRRTEDFLMVAECFAT